MVYSTPDNVNANSLFAILFKDALTEFLYDAKLAGLSFDLFNTSYGINVRKMRFFGDLLTIFILSFSSNSLATTTRWTYLLNESLKR